MGYPLDVAAQNAALDALLSRDVSGIPTTWEVALYDGDPRFGGTELTSAGGYARPILDANLTDWPAAAAGLKQSIEVDFGTSAGSYSDTATHWVLISGADSTTRWFFGLLADEVAVDAAGAAVVATLATYWNTES